MITSPEEEILKTSVESTKTDQPEKQENTTNSEFKNPNGSLENDGKLAGDKQEGAIS